MEPFVLVHVASSAVEGHLLQTRLEDEDIPTFVKGEGDGPYRMGPAYLWVAAEHEVQARLVIAEVRSGNLALPEDEDVSVGEQGEPERS